MTYLPKYQHDVFVSYAHGPKAGGKDLLGNWSRQFRDQLHAHIAMNLDTKDKDRQVDVWMDTRLARNQPLADIQRRVEGSALLVAIMSPFFLQGSWCADEARWFGEANRRRGGTLERIFVVRAKWTDETHWPPTLRDAAGHVLPGYPLHTPRTDKDDPTTPYGLAGTPDPNREYDTWIRQLALDITKKLKQIETGRDTAGGAPDAVGHSVFLGFMHDTIEVRADLRQRLTDAGLRVLPPDADDPVDEASLREQLDRHLGQCQALVLIANEYGGLWPREQPGGFIGLQIAKARDLGIPPYLWLQLDDLARAKRPDYRALLEALARDPGLAPRHADLGRFVAHITEELNRQAAAPDPVPGTDAVICANRPGDEASGLEFARAVLQAVRETGRGSTKFDFADPKMQRIALSNVDEEMRESDTVLVLCFDQDWRWVKPLLRELNQLNHLRTGSKTRLLVVGPRDRQRGIYDAESLGFETIDALNLAPDRLKDLLKQKMQSARHSNGAGRPRPPA